MLRKFYNHWETDADAYQSVMRDFVENPGIYKDVYLPKLKSVLTKEMKSGEILDLGCGEGTVTDHMRGWGYKMTGIDLSKHMIKLADDMYSECNFEVQSAEALTFKRQHFAAVVSNMAVHDMKNLSAVFHNVSKVIKKRGVFVFSIAHPCFFTKNSQDYFAGRSKKIDSSDYNKERSFKKQIPGGLQVVHYHRTISTYVSQLSAVGFSICSLDEIFDTTSKSLFKQVPLCLLITAKKE